MKNLLTILPTTLFIAFLVGSCQDQNQDSISENQREEQVITVTLGAQTIETGRYAGSYDDVNGVTLTYFRTDGKDDIKTVELTRTGVSNTTSSVRQWTGALSDVISGVYYNFSATAYQSEEACQINELLAECEFIDDYGCSRPDVWVDKEALGAEYFTTTGRNYDEDYSWLNSAGYDRKAMCSALLNLEPTNEYTKNVYKGSTNSYQLKAGSNNLRVTMEPVLKDQAVNQSIPTITSVHRYILPTDGSYNYEGSFSSYSPGQRLGFYTETQALSGTFLKLTAHMKGECSEEELASDPPTCERINKTNERTFFLCPNWNEQDPRDYWYDVLGYEDMTECDENGCTEKSRPGQKLINPCPDNVTLERSYIWEELQLTQTPPDEIEVTFRISQQDINSWTPHTEDQDHDLGLSNSVKFTVIRSSFNQAPQMIFMPTVQDISFTYDMATADFSYALDTTDLSSEIEIYSTLRYSEATPLGTPTPYLQIDHSGNGGSQTLFGRIDKDENYAADLKLTFVHKPTLSTYSSTFEIVASDKPKFGYAYENWQEIMRSGVCEHCNLPSFNMNGRANWQYDEANSRWIQTFYEWNNAEPSLYSLDILGATLNYADMSGSEYDYINFRNSSFLGTNFSGVTFKDSILNDSTFLNSKIYNTKFQRASLDNVLFSNDTLSSTQNQPYTDLVFTDSYGSNTNLTDLTLKLEISGGAFQNSKLNRNLVYQSKITGFTFSGQMMSNDIVETTIANSDFRNVDFSSTSFVDADFSMTDFRGANLFNTWFDRSSGTTLYLASCDEQTILPIYNNLVCDNGYLEFVETETSDAFLSLSDGKDRAAYLYEDDVDSFRLDVTNPRGIAIEFSAKNSGLEFNLYKSNGIGAVVPVDSATETILRTDGSYYSTWKYYTNLPALGIDEYFYVQVRGIRGVYYVVGYFEEN